jgi:predicted nucleotidyltransferase component of viral defense system
MEITKACASVLIRSIKKRKNDKQGSYMTLDIATHRHVLVRILKDIFTNSQIGPFLGFKGGTAALLFYNLSRFSVDLDFDLLDVAKEDAIFERIQELLKEYGHVKVQKKRYSLFFLLVYDQKLYGAQNIKVEINKRFFGSRYETKHYLGIAMRVMVQEDIVAHKLVAMHERMGSANRDIFDVWFFLKHRWPVNQAIVELRTKMSFRDFVHVCITELEKLGQRRILHGIGELVDAKQKAWIKEHLIEETIFLLKLLVEK